MDCGLGNEEKPLDHRDRDHPLDDRLDVHLEGGLEDQHHQPQEHDDPYERAKSARSHHDGDGIENADVNVLAAVDYCIHDQSTHAALANCWANRFSSR